MVNRINWQFLIEPAGNRSVADLAPYRELSTGVLFPESAELAGFSPDSDRWPVAHLRLSIEQGQPVCTALMLERSPLGPPIAALTFREVEIGDLLDQAVAWVAEQAQKHHRLLSLVDTNQTYTISGTGQPSFWTLSDENQSRRNAVALRRQRKITDTFLEEVAAVYRRDATGKPTAAVEHHFNTARRNAIRWVAQARERGFLPPYERMRRSKDGVD